MTHENLTTARRLLAFAKRHDMQHSAAAWVKVVASMEAWQ